MKTETSTNGATLDPAVLNKGFIGDLDDIMERTLLVNNFLMLGETGKAMFEKRELSGDGLEVGIEKRYLTKEVMSTLRTYRPQAEFTEEGMTYISAYEKCDVPIHIKFIKQKYKFFEHPDTVFYLAGNYKIPNPFEKYLKARWLIK